MELNQLMAMFLPAIMSLGMYDKLYNGESKNIKIIERYLKSVLIVNVIVYFITIYLVKQAYFIFTNQFTLKYMALAIVVAIVFPVVEKYIKANISASIEMEK